MAPANTMRLVVRGHSVGSEIWQCALWFKPVVTGDTVPHNNTEATNTLGAINSLAQFSTWLNGIASALLPTTAGVDSLALYSYPSGGNTAAAQAVLPRAIAGSAGGASLPLQTCLVASLRTDQSGRRYRGRIYLPLQASNLASGQLGNTAVDAQANNLAGFLSATKLATILPSGNGIYGCVASSAQNAATSITAVIVDSRPDTQRRRSTKLAPAYSKSTTVTL